MNDDGVQQTEEQPQTRRGRKRVRRNYASELTNANQRIEMAVRLLRKIDTSCPDGQVASMIEVAIDTLNGD